MASAYASTSSLIRTSRASYTSCIGDASFHRRRCRLSMADTNAPGNDTAAMSEAELLDTPTFDLQFDSADSTAISSRSYGMRPKDETQPVFQTNLQKQSTSSWKDRLVDISNIASFLCVLDCTLLPLVSIALPALSWVTGALSIGTSNNALLAGVSSFVDFLPALGHGVAVFFVIPVGLLTTVVNYLFGHKQMRFSVAALVGVILIYAANSSSGIGITSIDSFLTSSGIASHSHGGHIHDACGAIVGATTGMLTHSCGEGWAHRLTNTVGCAFLLGSNHFGKKFMERQSKGCAASALAEAWGDSDAGRRLVCPPGCGCEQPSYGASRVSTNAQSGGEMFFSWDRASGADKRGRGPDDVGRRNGRVRGRFRQ